MVKKEEAKEQKKGFIEAERDLMRGLTQKEKEDALFGLASHPIRPYLIGVMDELIRQGIYLSPAQQEGAKMLVKIIGGELEKGSKLLAKRDKERRQFNKKQNP